ncbi:MAG: YbhB/YbcL family Raf kinase inhibitor-like protein [Actinobacteria bacterium]|nr:YbhB/YbcL family Raf kinase inhibitor-like protein [Actinomycetota bacterium]
MEGGDIDLAFTCYGRKVSPPLQILGQPGGTVSMAVLLHSVDAPEDVLWLMANIAGGTVALGEGALPPDVVVATNSDGTAGFSPPCPPSGERRQYLLTVFALDTRLDVATVTAPLAPDTLGASTAPLLNSPSPVVRPTSMVG